MSSHFEIINTTNAPSPVGHYVQAIFRSPMLQTAGQIGLTPDGVMSIGVEAQTDQIFKNLLAIAAEVRMGPKNLFKTTVFLVDLKDGPLVNQYFEKYDMLAARSTVQVAALPKSALVEIEAIFCC